MELKNFNWGPGSFVIFYHLALFILLPVYLMSRLPSASLIVLTIVFLFLSGMSISAGYHRYYSHRAYTPNKVVEFFLLFFATMATQGSVIRWAYDHRMHHRFTDKEKDPHSIKKGFMYAHMLWIFEKPKPVEKDLIPDLIENKMVMFQDRYYKTLLVITNAISIVFSYFITHDIFGAIVFAWLLRLFLMHHFTWFINSLAHTYGARTYSGEQSAVDNYLIALVTFGEGYHNYHHVFASDYRNGIKWYHFDPSKWLIWSLSKLGFIKDMKKMNTYAIKRIMVLEDKRILLEKIKENNYIPKVTMEKKVHELSESLVTKLSLINSLSKKYWESKKVKDEAKTVRNQMREMKKSLNENWKAWTVLIKEIMSSA